MWEYCTVLSAVLEKGKQPYFAIDFKRGEKLDADTLNKMVVPSLRTVRDNITLVDKARQEKIVAGTSTTPTEPVQEVHEEGDLKDDINPDDIPF